MTIGPAGASAVSAAAGASLGVNIAAGGLNTVTFSTGYLVDKTDHIVQQVVNYYDRQGRSSLTQVTRQVRGSSCRSSFKAIQTDLPAQARSGGVRKL